METFYLYWQQIAIKVDLKPEELVVDNIQTKLKENKFNTYPAFHIMCIYIYKSHTLL